jgi:hypothetical protein
MPRSLYVTRNRSGARPLCRPASTFCRTSLNGTLFTVTVTFSCCLNFAASALNAAISES